MQSKFLTFDKGWKRIVASENDFYNFVLPNGERLVPKELGPNLLRRRQLIEACERDDELAYHVWIACKRDLLFFVNMFCWMQESREGIGTQYEEKLFPWITWPVQDWALTEMRSSVGKEHVIFTKPRAAAASWGVIALFFYLTTFEKYVNFGITSAKEAKADAKDDPSSVMNKLDLLVRYMPTFILNKGLLDRGPGRYVNRETHSTIMAYASTEDANTGGRNTAFLADEFGDFPARKDFLAVETLHAGVTNSLFMVSTYSERQNSAFNEYAGNGEFPAKRLRSMWTDNPPQAAGKYRWPAGGELEILDADYKFPADYPFVQGGRYEFRSPYFDLKSAGLSPRQIARQLMADPEGSSSKALDQEAVKRCLSRAQSQDRLKPLRRGSIAFVTEDYGATDFKVDFRDDATGPLRLWCELDGDGKADVKDCYAIAADVSVGVGASNSVISIWSRSTGKQVAEYVTGYDAPIKLARIAAALGWMFGGSEGEAYLTWDAKGIGASFRDEIKRIGYGHLHAREAPEEITGKPTKKLGFAISGEGPGEILADLIDAMDGESAELRSEDCYREFGEYVMKKGKIVHDGATKGVDDYETSSTHGDRAVAAAMAWALVRLRPHRKPSEKKIDLTADPPYGCLAWRMQRHEKMQADSQDELVFS